MIGTLAFALLATLAAIPALAAESRAPEAAVGRAWLGVSTQALTPELSEATGYKGKGVLVNRVIPDSPADRAGVRKGDVIASLNARTVDSPAALADLVGQSRAGQAVSLRVVRDGKTQSLSATLAARGDMEEDAPDMMGGHEMREFEFEMPRDLDMNLQGMLRGMGRGRLGVRIEALNPDLGSYFSVPDGKGVLVVEVLKETPAERAGLKAGDVITKVGDRAVGTPEDLVQALGDDAGKVMLAVVRKGSRRSVEAELDKREMRKHVIRIRGEGGPMGMREGRRGPGGPAERGEIDELRRQIEDLRRKLDRLERN